MRERGIGEAPGEELHLGLDRPRRDELPPDALQLGKRCTSVTVHGDTAVLEFFRTSTIWSCGCGSVTWISPDCSAWNSDGVDGM